MSDIPLITKVHGVKTWTHRNQTIPTTYLKVQVDTENGRLGLSLSIDAARELVANLEHILRDEHSRYALTPTPLKTARYFGVNS